MLLSPTQVTGVRMKLIAWAIALAAAGLTPAAAQTPQAAQPQAAVTAEAAAQPTAENAPGGSTAPANPSAVTTTETGVGHAVPQQNVGMPIRAGTGIQEQVTDVGKFAAGFHNNWLLALCVIISLVVLVLLAVTMIKFRRGANPTPSRTSHNTALEVAWTLIPVLVLVAIAIPSMRLLQTQYNPPPADLTVKVTGNQWFWTYSYPDNGGFEIVSNILKEKADVKPGERFRTDADGPPLLAADERLVLPAGKVIKFLVTSNDVIHAFWVPAFWSKIDANPGQVNQIWAKVDSRAFTSASAPSFAARATATCRSPSRSSRPSSSMRGSHRRAARQRAPSPRWRRLALLRQPPRLRQHRLRPKSNSAEAQPATNQAATAQN